MKSELEQMIYESCMYRIYDIEQAILIKEIWDSIEVDIPEVKPKKVEKELDPEWDDELKAMNKYAEKFRVRQSKKVKLDYRRE